MVAIARHLHGRSCELGRSLLSFSKGPCGTYGLGSRNLYVASM